MACEDSRNTASAKSNSPYSSRLVGGLLGGIVGVLVVFGINIYAQENSDSDSQKIIDLQSQLDTAQQQIRAANQALADARDRNRQLKHVTDDLRSEMNDVIEDLRNAIANLQRDFSGFKLGPFHDHKTRPILDLRFL